jgi:hypothetical protein
VAKELTQQKTDFIFGSALLFFSFALQFFSKAISGLENILLPFPRLCGVALCLILASALLFPCYLLWRDLSNKRMGRLLKLIAKEE